LGKNTQKVPKDELMLKIATKKENSDARRIVVSKIYSQNLKSVIQQISDYDFELLIDIREETSMSKVVQQVSIVGL